MKTAIVLGAGGFIGSHMVNRLQSDGYHVIGADLKYPEFSDTKADEFFQGDLRDPSFVDKVLTTNADLVIQLAADMGGAQYIFTGENDADIMHNSVLINLNVANTCVKKGVKKVFYSSSACIYPERNQLDPNNPNCVEDSAYPAAPDSEYGWEKLFSERIYASFQRNKGLDIRVARFHNIYGPEGTYKGGKEKAPAAMCRKALTSVDNLLVFGDGKQTRSFLYIDDCVDAVMALIESDFTEPVNIGSEEMVTINQLAEMAISLSGRNIEIENDTSATCTGVRGRCSDNTLMFNKVGWSPSVSLKEGLTKTCEWISSELKKSE
tara:strand:+ start:790 stop:1755 length:966 start_codon:yes stop_codon:yes gene_type:complete